jgi:hypothetical protein
MQPLLCVASNSSVVWSAAVVTVECSDIFVNENDNENENYCAFVHENEENENFLKNENRIRTKINLSERIEINY